MAKIVSKLLLGASVSLLPYLGMSQETPTTTPIEQQETNYEPQFIVNKSYKDKLEFLIETIFDKTSMDALQHKIAESNTLQGMMCELNTGTYQYQVVYYAGPRDDQRLIAINQSNLPSSTTQDYYVDEYIDGIVDKATSKCMFHEEKAPEAYNRISFIYSDIDAKIINEQLDKEKKFQNKYEETVDKLIEYVLFQLASGRN